MLIIDTHNQQIPPSLESLTNSISSNHSALDPTPPTSDPPVEFNLVRSWGLFANTIEELMADYIQKKGDLIGVFGLRAAIHDRLVTFNESFQVNIPFTPVFFPANFPLLASAGFLRVGFDRIMRLSCSLWLPIKRTRTRSLAIPETPLETMILASSQRRMLTLKLLARRIMLFMAWETMFLLLWT